MHINIFVEVMLMFWKKRKYLDEEELAILVEDRRYVNNLHAANRYLSKRI